MQQSNLHLDISAHLVSAYVSPDSPILRVLFHAGAEAGGHFQRQKICVLLHVAYDGHVPPLKGRCMPEGEDGVCVAEVYFIILIVDAFISTSTTSKMGIVFRL